MNDAQFKEINTKLDLLIKLLAAQIFHDKEYRDQVEILNNIGMQPKEIAEVVGKTPNNVTVTLHLIKKKKIKKNTD